MKSELIGRQGDRDTATRGYSADAVTEEPGEHARVPERQAIDRAR